MPSTDNKTIRTPRSESKTAKAAEIFTAMQGAARKDVISRFTNELKLTAKGASTYYQTCRAKAGLVQNRNNAPMA